MKASSFVLPASAASGGRALSSASTSAVAAAGCPELARALAAAVTLRSASLLSPRSRKLAGGLVEQLDTLLEQAGEGRLSPGPEQELGVDRRIIDEAQRLPVGRRRPSRVRPRARPRSPDRW